MASLLNATTSSGLVTSADNSGSLQLQTNNGTTAVTIDTSQRVAFVAGTDALPAITTTGDTNTGIFFPAADTTAITTGGSERMRIDSSGNVGIGTSSPTSKLQSQTSSSGSTPNMLSLVNNTGSAANATGVKLWMSGRAAQADSDRGTYIESVTTDTNNAHAMAFATSASGAAPTERMRIDSSGNLLVGCTSSRTGNASLSFEAGNSGIFFRQTGSGSFTQVIFTRNTGTTPTTAGTIETTGTTTSYVTSSDYRMKEDVAKMTGALDKVCLLNPVTYTWKSDGSYGEGFIAHELQEVCPLAVTGEKDAVDEEGNIKPQGIDTSFLVATLTAAIQELNAKVDAQALEIQALKGAQ
jgi:hypothetical protein